MRWNSKFQHGSLWRSLTLLNLYLLGGLKENSSVEGTSDGLFTDNILEDSCLPQHVHLSFGDSVAEINIVWATKRKCVSQVKYGTDPWNLNVTVGAKYNLFTELNSQGLHHLYRVKLKGLQPEKTYYYIPVSGGDSMGPFYFKTLQQGNNWSPCFLMFGDLGIHTNSIPSLGNEALSGQYAAVFHVGDFAYDMKNDDGMVGDYFMQLIQPIAASIPYMTCPGNHEIDSDSFAHYRNRFAMPGSEWPIPLKKMWYSIDIGPVHFVSYSSEVFFANNGAFEMDQRRWLEEDLMKANKNRKTTPWIVAFGHRPMYCSTRIGDDCSKPYSYVRAGFEELFHRQSVDLIIQAHEHNYERLWPMFKGRLTNKSYENPDVPVQIITGAAGSKEGVDHFISSIKPEWSAFRLDEGSLNSYGRLHIINFTHALWEQRAVEGDSLIDSIWIVKERNFSTPMAATVSGDRGSFISSHIIPIIIFAVGGLVILAIFWVRIMLRYHRKKLNETRWGEKDFKMRGHVGRMKKKIRK